MSRIWHEQGTAVSGGLERPLRLAGPCAALHRAMVAGDGNRRHPAGHGHDHALALAAALAQL